MAVMPLRALALSCLFLPTHGQPGKVLVIGDSYAEYSKTYLAKYCGITVVNEGQGGTTSEQWCGGSLQSLFSAAAQDLFERTRSSRGLSAHSHTRYHPFLG